MIHRLPNRVRALLLAFAGLGAYAQETSQLPQISFVSPEIARVQWAAGAAPQSNNTGVCVYPAKKVKVKTVVGDRYVTYSTDKLKVVMDKSTSSVSFYDATTGRLLLREDSIMPRESEVVVQERIRYDEASARMENTANGQVTVKDEVGRDTIGVSTRYLNHFAFTQDEGLYGLGSHMEDYMNLNGKTLYLVQHNLKAAVPVLVSTRGYGLLFDAGCAMKFDKGTVEYDAAQSLDYYFMKGETMDKVVAGYRYLTGQVPMLPRYAFGYIQSKERYVSSSDLISTLKRYRDSHVPIDMIVQDWSYWPQGWGYMKMDERYYPSPKALADSIHDMNARLMVSIWPNPQNCPQEEDFRQKGYMLGHAAYDAFNVDARRYYWEYANREFFNNGFDAWWCDCSEPVDGDWNNRPEPENGKPYGWDDHERRYRLNKEILTDALGAERANLYSLYHSMGIYENQRAATDRKRVLNLTRSTYAGQQRYGTVVWNGDTHASWASFKQQIPAGLNYMATGNPYWTVDAGSFFVRKGWQWFWQGEFPGGVADDDYKEYYTRMLQWATFLPLMRSHGTDTPREIWQFGAPGTPYYDAILKMINLRYSLLPYIYSMAAAQTLEGYTMARMLAFDFADDPNVLDIKDEYMFGSLLVCPVTEASATSRRVYLPAGSLWIDYWTGASHNGGQWIEAVAPIDRLPLFVRGGSIITTAEPTEYADAQIGKPLTINVYPGGDAAFCFYEDAGDSYDYEQGQYVTVPITWNEAKRTLTIGKQAGSFLEMAKRREITIKAPGFEKTVSYVGKQIKCRL